MLLLGAQVISEYERIGHEPVDVLGREPEPGVGSEARQQVVALGALLPQQLEDAAEQIVVGARQHRQADRVGVLLHGGGDDLLGRLVETGVDHLEAGIAQSARHDLRSAVVAIQSRLGHQDSDLPRRLRRHG